MLAWTLVWSAGAFVLLARQPTDPLLDQDEVYWIGSAYYYDLAFLQQNWTHEAWKLLPARENPPVSKYVIGFGLDLAGHRISTIDNLSYFYMRWLRWEKTPDARPTTPTEEKRAQVVWAASPAYREQMRKVPRAPLPRAVVDAARSTILVCAALSSLGLFLIGITAGEYLAGLVASLLILVHPVAVSAASHAMSDTIALFFSIGAAASLLVWYRRLSADPLLPLQRLLPGSVVTGCMLALACGAKMNSLVLVLLAGLLTFAVTVQRAWQGAWRNARVTIALGVIVLGTGLAVFIVINPAILIDFPGALAAVTSEHYQTQKVQVDLHDLSPEGWWERTTAVVAMAFLDWRIFAVMIAIASGLAICRWNSPMVRLVVAWWVLAFACVVQWLPFAWPRYTLPVLAPSCLLVGLAISAGVQWLRERGSTGLPGRTKS